MGLPKDAGLELFSKHGPGKRNLITDVPGVTVGNVTLKGSRDGGTDSRDINTGVTAILPHPGNIFRDKVMAGVSVINGFSKSQGLVQVEEMGTIETPIILTNTFSVGTATNALVKYMLRDNPDIGISTGTVNCLVTECNDGRLNDIRGMHVTEEDVLKALSSAGEDFEEGAVGGGTGMVCLGFKGGIGSSSRVLSIDGKDYTVGALVMSNFGSSGNLVIGGDHIGKRIRELKNTPADSDKGSIIMVIATDIPLSERQLKRVAKRATISLGRVGSYCGDGSGDIAIAFTTANRIPHYSDTSLLDIRLFHDEKIDKVFEASVEAVEEAIISSLYHAETTRGIRGRLYEGLREYL